MSSRLLSSLALLSALLSSTACLADSLQLRLQGLRYTREQAADPSQALLEVPARQELSLEADGRYRVLNDTLYPGQIRFRFIETGGPEGSVTFDALQWRSGIEWQRNDAAVARANHAELLFLAPAWLLKQARDRQPALSDAGEGRAERFVDSAGRSGLLWFDRNDGRLLRAKSASLVYEYGSDRFDAAGLQPRQISVSDGKNLRARWQVEILVTQPLAAAAYQPPAGYVDPQERGPLRATPLGAGAYRVDGTPSGYHLAFVVGKTGVAVFDTPISPDEGARVRALIASTAPGLPIAYVVLSHGHRDHTAGLPAYVESGTQVIVGAGGRAALARQHGEALAARAVELTEAEREIDMGERRLRLFPLPSSHARDMLVVHDAAAEALYQGDLFYLPEQGPVPPAFEVSEELSRLIETRALKLQQIVGIHGRSGGPAELAHSLALRRRACQLQAC